MSKMSRFGALFTLSSFLTGGSCLRQPGMDMGSGDPDRAELVEVARTDVCSSTLFTPFTGGKFTISFTMTLANAAGTQCVWCEDVASDAISSSEDRLVLEGGRLKLHINGATPEETVFAPIFHGGQEYTVAIVSDDSKSILFMDGEVVQVKNLKFEGTTPSFDAGHFGCLKKTAGDENELQVQGNSSTSFEFVNSVDTDLLGAYTSQKDLAVGAATDFAAVATAVENWGDLDQAVADELALLNKLIICKDQVIQTDETYTSSAGDDINMTWFECSRLPEEGEDSCETKLTNFKKDGNDMMTALHTQYGNCDIEEVVTQNTITRERLGEINDGRCDMGRQFLVMHSDATYIGAAEDMKSTIIGQTDLLTFSAETGYPVVTFKNPNMHIPVLTADSFSDDSWPDPSQYTNSNASSKISVWDVEDNPNAFIDLAC